MAFIGVALIATAFVGYSEELLTRGLLVQGARASGFTEIKVFLISMVVFGFLHGLNIINGQDIVTTIQQVIFTALAGGVYYTMFRKSGFLVVPMILHGLWDFSLLTQGVSQLNHIAAASSGSMMLLVGMLATWIAYILLIPAARNFNVKKEKIEETKAS
jgi:membrane protease YdiL (CAAX protease family)